MSVTKGNKILSCVNFTESDMHMEKIDIDT